MSWSVIAIALGLAAAGVVISTVVLLSLALANIRPYAVR